MKDNSEILGINLINEKKFYWVDNGQHTPGPTSIDRLRSILTGRGVINMTDEGKTRYRVLSLELAKAEGLDIEVIHINKHVKNQRAAEPKTYSYEGTLWD